MTNVLELQLNVTILQTALTMMAVINVIVKTDTKVTVKLSAESLTLVLKWIAVGLMVNVSMLLVLVINAFVIAVIEMPVETRLLEQEVLQYQVEPAWVRVSI